MSNPASGAIGERSVDAVSVSASGAAAGPWAAAIADLTMELHSSFADVHAVTAAVAACAVKILPGVTAAGVVVIGRDGVLTCRTATNPQVLQMVQAEHRTGQGPCRHVLDHTHPPKAVIGDLPEDQRWTRYAAEAVSIGIAGVMAVRLESGHAANQALLLISDSPLTRALLDGVDVFAVHAAVAAAQAQTYADLLGAVHSRDIIGQAKGILMERHKIGGSQAFDLLAKASQNTNIALREVAAHIVDTGKY